MTASARSCRTPATTNDGGTDPARRAGVLWPPAFLAPGRSAHPARATGRPVLPAAGPAVPAGDEHLPDDLRPVDVASHRARLQPTGQPFRRSLQLPFGLRRPLC